MADPKIWMWAEACDMLAQAERLHRQFFVPSVSRTLGPAWEPPVDLYETDELLWIQVALPGVAPEMVQVAIEGRMLTVVGERRIPAELRGGLVHRKEIPHGRFERGIQLPLLPLELLRHELVDGCLLIVLRKI